MPLRLVIAGVLLLGSTPVLAQQTPEPIASVPNLSPVLSTIGTSKCSGQPGLACAIPNLYGPYGLVLPNPTHAAHFTSSFQSNFSALNTAIATQLTLLPLASPASGFIYEYDPNTGLQKVAPESFGPVLTERAETIGKHKFFVGATYQRFRFNKLDGQDLHNLPVVFTHTPDSFRGTSEPFETQFVSSENSIDIKVNQFTVFATYGITNHIDLSLAVPVMQVGFNVASYATINRTVNTEPTFVSGAFRPCCSSGPPFAHFFNYAEQATSLTHTFSNDHVASDSADLYYDPSNSNASGFGDVTVRGKVSVLRSEHVSLALLTDLRFPTGDERNFLGSGAYGIKPFAAISLRTKTFTPHFNLGYQWNGSSLLGGNILTGTKDNLPSWAFLSAGTDIGVARRVTFAVDYIGEELIDAPRIRSSTFTSALPLTATGQVGSFDTISPFKGTYNQSNAAVGAKVNLVGKLLLTGNLLIALNDGGLRDRVVPLIGLGYSF